MSVDTILISRGPGETRVALLSEGRLVELLVSRPGQEGVAGNIYLGRVEAALKGLDAAFVDVGLERPGFLALPEARPAGIQAEPADAIGDYLSEGDAVLVQVLRDPVEDKGAKLTTHITLPGINLVFRPDHPGVNVSRRIEDEAERDRLTALVEGLAPEGGGFIVRTAAAGARNGDEDGILEQESQGLVARWAAIRHRRANVKAPSVLYTEPGPGLRALRDFGGGVGKIVADG
ncbi:MAG: ribonuclease E/G, partial [Rhodospirillales bacterium]